jgi:hypothetical protein
MRNLGARVVVLLTLMVASAGTRPLAAQTVLSAQQGLDFGQLVPGTPTYVAPTDVVRRGEFLVQGTTTVTLQFVLPTFMVSAGGSKIPLIFGAADAILREKNKETRVDPAATIQVKLNNGVQEASVYLGGTVRPTAGQLAGSYQATVILMVVGGG